MVGLIDSLTKLVNEEKNISEFVQSIKTIIGDLTIIGHNLSDGEIIVHILNGFTNDYKELKVALRARESPLLISFEELVEKLSDYKTSIKKCRGSNMKDDNIPITAQFSKRQHNEIVRNCSK